ncbi:MAG: hypothetical protein H7234_09265 [Herminiimonas sp.]|nr:hypothetical protein [Herminiimonas sp.]
MQHDRDPSGRRAISNLETFHQRSGGNLTNAQVLPTADHVDRSRPEVRAALRRTASFLLVRDLLRDVADAVPAVMAAEERPATRPRVAMLVTAQLEALHKHVEACRVAAWNKVQGGQRIAPLAMRGPAFDQFMQAHVPTLTGIVDGCTQVGAQRTHVLEHYLQVLARNYLGATDRLPRGVAGNEYFDLAGIRFTDDSIGVRLTDCNTLHGMYFDAGNGGNFGAMFIDPENCSHPCGNPSKGSLDEQFHASGFEHCSIRQKQAAVLIQKTFLEVLKLEESVAQLKGKTSTNLATAHQARASERDCQYSGALETGDFFDCTGIDPADQRDRLVNAVRVLAPVAREYAARTGTALVGDPGLDAWLQSPQFAKDLESLAMPEIRNWMLGIACVKEALLRTPVFAKAR